MCTAFPEPTELYYLNQMTVAGITEPSLQKDLPVEETFSIAFHDIRMFLSQSLPLLAKSCVTIL